MTRGHPIRKLRVVLRRAGRLAEIEVDPLRQAGAAELAARILGAPIAPSLAAVVYDRTQGVPFFVEELVAALATEELVATGEEGLVLAPGREVPLPDTVRDAVLVMAEQMSDSAREALEVAAVAGSASSSTCSTSSTAPSTSRRPSRLASFPKCSRAPRSFATPSSEKRSTRTCPGRADATCTVASPPRSSADRRRRDSSPSTGSAPVSTSGRASH